MDENDFNAEATTMAKYVSDTSFDTERGAIPYYRAGVFVAFGNDSYADDQRSKDEVYRLREALNRHGSKILGFGTDPRDGYTWAMLVETRDIEILHAFVRTCWHSSRPRRQRMPLQDQN